MDKESPESDIRKRAAWLLAMLAVVAGLFVVLSVTLLKTSGGGGTHATIAAPPDTLTPSPSGSSGSSTPQSRAPSTARSTSPSTPGSSSPATSTGPVPTPSCPTSAKCAVQGDIGAAMSAINDYRTTAHKKPVSAMITPAAQKCALSEGSDCPTSFVWVHVNDLSGPGLLKAVKGFNSNDDLLGNTATSFAIGWAYDPGSKSLSAAVIRND